MFPLLLLQSRELEVSVYWRDYRSLCGVAFLRLEEFLDNQRHQIKVPLEPQGSLFAEVGVFLVYIGFKTYSTYFSQLLA